MSKKAQKQQSKLELHKEYTELEITNLPEYDIYTWEGNRQKGIGKETGSLVFSSGEAAVTFLFVGHKESKVWKCVYLSPHLR